MNISQQLATVSSGVAQLAVRFLVSFSARLRLAPGCLTCVPPPEPPPLLGRAAGFHRWGEDVEEQSDEYR